MDKNRKTSHILNIFQYDADGHVVLPASLTLSIAPGAADNNSKVPTTAWVRTYVSGLTYATQSYVNTQVANLVASSPATLDTLNELAAALGNDPNFATTVATSIGTKQAQLNGTGFVKVTGTTVSYDNSTYLTTSSASSTYVSYTGATQDVNLGVYSIATNSVLANQITVNPSGSTGAQVFLKHGSSFSLPNGFGSIGSSTGNQFRLYQVSSEGVWKGANISLNSITSSATRTYTLPDADGTLALTSSLGAYLPLAGGTLTGALNGTSASFTGDVGVVKSSPLYYLQNSTSITTGTRGDLAWYNSSVSTVALIRASAITDNVGTSLEFHTRPAAGSLTQALTLASTGAATFSSSVVANGVSSIGQEQAFTFQRTTGTPSDIFSLNVDSGAAYLYNNTTANTLMFWREGGNVGIGAFPSNSKLLVAGTHVSGNSIIGVLPIGNNTATIGLYNASGVRRGLFYSDTGFVRVESDSDQIQIAPAGTVALTLATTGAATFSSSVTAYGSITVINGIYTLPALTPSYFGYSGYGVLIVGNSNSAQTRSIAFNVDVSGNPSGAFSGYGNEYIWRNAGSFITPNSINNGYNTLLSWNTSGQITFNQAATFSSTVTATELTLNKGASDTIGAGSYVYYSNVGGTRGAVHQLNASFGLDTFTFDGSTWSRRMTVTNNGNVGIGNQNPKFYLHSNDDVTIPNNRYLNFTSEINAANFNKSLVVSYTDNSATSQPNQIGIILHNNSNTDNTFSPALVFGSKSNSNVYSQATAAIAGRRLSLQQDPNWHGGELYFWTATSGGASINQGMPADQPAMILDSRRRMRVPAQSSFTVYSSTNIDLTSVESKLSLDSESYDTGGVYDPTNRRFTAPVSGKYLFTFTASVMELGGGQYNAVYIKINGGATGYRFRAPGNRTNAEWGGISGNAILNLAANDYVELFGYAASGYIRLVGGETIWGGYLLG